MSAQKFVDILKLKWPILKKQIICGDTNVPLLINKLSSIINCSVGIIYDNHEIVFNISSNAANKFIPEMEELYLLITKHFPDIIVEKYMKSQKIVNFEIGDFVVDKKHFKFHNCKGDLLNLVIVVDKAIAYKVLEEKDVTFETGSSRKVFLPKLYQNYYPLDIFFVHFYGEYELLNYIGYIEYLPSDHKLANGNLRDIDELAALLDVKRKDEKQCIACEKHHWHCTLKLCCDVWYCSEKCRLNHLPIHKSFCSKVK